MGADEKAVETMRIRTEWMASHPEATAEQLDQIYEAGEMLVMAIEGYELQKAGKSDSHGHYIG